MGAARQLGPVLAVLAVLAGAGGTARAGVIFSSFGPGDSHETHNTYVESGPNTFLGINRSAFSFGVGGATDFLFDGARLALAKFNGTNEITLRLYADAGGHPGAVLESISLSNQLTPAPGSVVTFASSSRPLLEHGQTYWVLPLASTDTFVGWLFNDQKLIGPEAISHDLEPTTWVINASEALPAFDVSGSPVPEPASLALLGLGACGLLAFVRRRGKAAAG
jgi:hypothetical protein